MNVFAMSLITNECVTSYDEDSEANHEEVLDVGRMRQDILRKYVSRLVKKFAEFHDQSPWNPIQLHWTLQLAINGCYVIMNLQTNLLVSLGNSYF